MNIFLKMLFLCCIGLAPAYLWSATVAEEEPLVQSHAQISNIERFINHLWNINEVVSSERSAEQNAIFIEELEALEQDIHELNACLEKVSGGQPTSLYTMFRDLPTSFSESKEWPTPGMLTSWRKEFGKFKVLLSRIVCGHPSSSGELFHIIDLITNIKLRLSEKILTNDFFGFSLLDTVCDFAFYRPTKFIKKHPYIAAGIGVALSVAGFLTYRYLTRHTRWMKAHSAQLFFSHQPSSESGAWALYGQWCLQQTTVNGVTDAEKYKTLRDDHNQFRIFRHYIAGCLQPFAPAGYTGPLMPLASNVKNVHMQWLIACCNAERDPAFALHPLTINTIHYSLPVFIPSLGFLSAANNLASTESLNTRYNANHDGYFWHILHFNQAPGNHVDFIANLAENQRNSHFIHVRAVKDTAAQDGIKLLYSDSQTPNLEQYEKLGTGLRAFLQPLQPLNPPTA